MSKDVENNLKAVIGYKLIQINAHHLWALLFYLNCKRIYYDLLAIYSKFILTINCIYVNINMK